jgi:hypothetical protein
MDYDIPKSVEQCRAKLREEFEKHRHVTDIRVIDMLVIKVCVKVSYVIFTVNFLMSSCRGSSIMNYKLEDFNRNGWSIRPPAK